MRYFFLTSIIIFSINYTYSQDKSNEQLFKVIHEYVANLKSKKIDTICIYSDYSTERGITPTSIEKECIYTGTFIPTYIFWKDKNKTFVCRKDNCFDSEIIEIKESNFWNIIFKNEQAIFHENSKNFEFIDKKTKKKYTSSTSHSRYRWLEIFLNNNHYNTFFDDFDLLETSSGEVNINFIYNNLLKSKLLVDELEIVASKLKFINYIKRM